MDPYGYMRKDSKGRRYVWKRSDKQESSSRIGVQDGGIREGSMLREKLPVERIMGG
jgi:hypothetical protein